MGDAVGFTWETDCLEKERTVESRRLVGPRPAPGRSPVQVFQVSAWKANHVLDHQAGVPSHSLPSQRSSLAGRLQIKEGFSVGFVCLEDKQRRVFTFTDFFPVALREGNIWMKGREKESRSQLFHHSDAHLERFQPASLSPFPASLLRLGCRAAAPWSRLGWFGSGQAALGHLHPHHPAPEDVCGFSEVKTEAKSSSVCSLSPFPYRYLLFHIKVIYYCQFLMIIQQNLPADHRITIKPGAQMDKLGVLVTCGGEVRFAHIHSPGWRRISPAAPPPPPFGSAHTTPLRRTSPSRCFL